MSGLKKAIKILAFISLAFALIVGIIYIASGASLMNPSDEVIKQAMEQNNTDGSITVEEVKAMLRGIGTFCLVWGIIKLVTVALDIIILIRINRSASKGLDIFIGILTLFNFLPLGICYIVYACREEKPVEAAQ